MTHQTALAAILVLIVVQHGCAKPEAPPTQLVLVESATVQNLENARSRVNPTEASSLGPAAAEIWAVDAERLDQLRTLQRQGVVTDLQVEPGNVWPLMRQTQLTAVAPQLQVRLRQVIGDTQAGDFVVAHVDLPVMSPTIFGTRLNLRLPMPGGQMVQLNERRQVATGTWEFDLPGGNATLSLGSTGLRGTIQTDAAAFLIRPLGDGEHVIFKPQRPAVPEELPPDGGGDDFDPTIATTTCKDDEITILPLYTEAVEKAIAGLGTISDFSTDGERETNAAMSAAGVGTSVTALAPQKITFAHSASLKTEVSELTKRGEKSGDAIQKLRDKTSADVVLLFTTAINACGQVDDAVLKRKVALPSQAYFVISPTVANCTFTFAHELGHLLGQRHHDDTVSAAEKLAHGFCESTDSFATIMASMKTCPTSRVQIWSDPTKKFKNNAGQSVPAGDNVKHHVASVLPKTAKIAGGFRCGST